MNGKSLVPLSIAVVLAACAEMPESRSGLVVDEMIAKQVANPGVIYDPRKGVGSGFDAERGDKVMTIHRQTVGSAQRVEKVITTSATGQGK